MSYRAEIDRLLASPPPDWKRQWRNARVQLRALGYKAPALPDATKALMALSLTAGGRRSGDRVVGTVPVPPAVRDEAMRAVRMAHRHDYGAWNFIGLARAIQLATIPRIDARSVERMRGFFTRHAKDAEAAGFGDDAHPSRGYLAHLVWGGDPAKEWVMGMEKRARKNPEDYRMRHRPSEDGPLASDMGTGEYMPKDVLTHPHYYTGFRPFLSEFWPAFLAAQGKPAARLTVYRALPSEHTTFRSGDWVTPSLSYAKMHLESNVEGGHIVAASVPASTLRFAGDDLMEWGYWGPTVEGTPARVRRNPLAQPSPTMAFSFRKDAIPGVVEVYLYEPEELDDPARSLVGGAMLTLAAGDRWETQGMAACPGYGPLVYDLAASVLQQRIHATSDQTEAAKRFWARQGKRYIAPMKPEAFAKKYGVTPKELFLRGYELTPDDYRRMGDELSTVFWGAKEAEKAGKPLALLRCAVPNGRRQR